MSHFSLTVHISAKDENLYKNGEAYLEEVLMPWHEYESTGIQNKYVKHVIVTEDAIDTYFDKRKVFLKIGPDQKKEYIEPWDLCSDNKLEKRLLTEEEQQLAEKGKYQLKDTEYALTRDDTFGPMTHVFLVPDEYTKTEISICYLENFVEFIQDCYGIGLVIHNMNEAPNTGSYIYAMPNSFFGPFKENTPENEIREKLRGTSCVFQYTNPNAKWDWWSIGGRFRLPKKDGTSCNACQIKDLRMYDPNKKPMAEKIWNYIMEGKFEGPEAEKSIFIIEYCWSATKESLSRYPSKEEYINDYCKWRPYAFVKDGIWYEPGQMGWFACSFTTPESEKIYRDNCDRMSA